MATDSITDLLELIEYHGNGIYVVPSRSTPDTWYTVNLNTGYCNCPATVQCWHLRVCKIRQEKAKQEVIELMTTEAAAPEYPALDAEHGVIDWTAMLDYYIALLDYVAELEAGKKKLAYASTDDKRRIKKWDDRIHDYTQMTDGMRMMLRMGGLDVGAMEKARREETGKVRPEPARENEADREKRHAEERARREKEGDEAFSGRVQDIRR